MSAKPSVLSLEVVSHLSYHADSSLAVLGKRRRTIREAGRHGIDSDEVWKLEGDRGCRFVENERGLHTITVWLSPHSTSILLQSS